MLHRVERHAERHICELGVGAAELADGHLVLFELEVGNAVIETAHHHVVRKLVLIGEAGGRNRLEPLQKSFVELVAPDDCVE